MEYPVAYGPSGELVGLRAKRDIGLCESYLYIPVNLTINEEQFKRSWIGEIYDKHHEDFKDDYDYEHFTLIFFVAYQMSIGKKSFWYPYFQVAADADLPLNWDSKDLDLLEDDVLKM